MTLRRLAALLAAALALLVPVAAAHAAAPANDARADAQSLDPLPAAVNGTTVGATIESAEPRTECGQRKTGPSVWYTATPDADGRVVVRVNAHGDLDVIVDVFQRVRSEAQFVNCDASNSQGNAAFGFAASKGVTYLVRVSQLPTSVAGAFTLQVTAPIAQPHPPGKLLAPAGVTQSLDAVQTPTAAWSYVFHAGTSYRIHLSGRGDHCSTNAIIYVPGTRSFSNDDDISDQVACGGYRLFTPKPGQGGRYPIFVSASSDVSGPQTYHLQIAPAGPDDTAPGIPLHDGEHAHGSLAGGHIDLIDLYRFTVTKRSVTYLRLSGGSDLFLQLIDSHGRHIADGDDSIRARLRPGHYFVVVRADGNGGGRYTLIRLERLVTSTSVALNGGVGGLTATVTTTPAAGGRYVITFERFDPLAGWLFAKEVHLSGHGNVSASYSPPGPGKYRAKAVYLGSKAASGSHSGFAKLEIADSGDS